MSADAQYYLDGFAHLEWEINSPQQIRTSGRFVRKIGYMVDFESALAHLNRFNRMKGLYDRKNQASRHVHRPGSASLPIFSPILDSPPSRSVISSRPCTFRKRMTSTDHQSKSRSKKHMILAKTSLYSTTTASPTTSRHERLAKMCKTVTPPDGSKKRTMD